MGRTCTLPMKAPRSFAPGERAARAGVAGGRGRRAARAGVAGVAGVKAPEEEGLVAVGCIGGAPPPWPWTVAAAGVAGLGRKAADCCGVIGGLISVDEGG